MLEEDLVLKSDFKTCLEELKGSAKMSQTYRALRNEHIGLNVTISSNQKAKPNLFAVRKNYKIVTSQFYSVCRNVSCSFLKMT